MKTYRNCIYRLYFEGDEKSYVGSASNFNNRYRQHIKELLDGIHSNRLLQFAFNKFGVLAFKWEILERDIPNKKLLARENYYILKYKACTEGYNQAYSTNNAKGNEVFVNEYVNLDDNDVIERFLERHEVEIREIHVNKKYENLVKATFSKEWWKNYGNKENLTSLCNVLYNQIKHISDGRIINTMVLCNELGRMIETFALEIDTRNEKYNKVIDSVIASIKKYHLNKYPCREYTDIVLASALNPFHMDMVRMTERQRYQYRLIKLIRLLGNFNLSNKITLHIPKKYYDGYRELLEEYKKKAELI